MPRALYWSVTLTVALVACTDPTTLHQCGASCYTGPEDTRGVGLCRDGIIDCTETGTVCAGQVLPAQFEVCDHLDHNCDGSTNARIEHEFARCDYTLSRQVRTSTGSCSLGSLRCRQGELTCVGAIAPEEEICDKRDNDCDGLIDEMSDFDLMWCYDGDPSTALFGPCRPGYLFCDRGEWMCRGQVLPRAKDICGNEVDDDCNGVVDDVATSTTGVAVPMDVVFIVDRSGSMFSPIANVQRALDDFINLRAADARFHYWLYDLPGVPRSNVAEPNTVCHPDLTRPLTSCDVPTFRSALRRLAATHGGNEPSYDILYDLATGIEEIDWTPGAARIVVFFGDEEGQSFLNRTEREVMDAIRAAGIIFYGFVAPHYVWDYDDIARGSGGQTFDVASDALDLVDAFDTVLTPRCEG